MIFVFGSNESGVHGAGAALDALKHHGAVKGVGFGPQGNSFAIPTKNWKIQTLSLNSINHYIERFLTYATLNPTIQFQITRIGCGLAGFKDEKIATLFHDAPPNCWFDGKWKPFMRSTANFWGTF